MRYASCALAVLALFAAAPASAAVIVTSYSVRATFVTPAGLAPLPFSSLTGTYTLSYDTAVTNNNAAITLTALNLDFAGLHFDTTNSGKQFLNPTTNPKTLQIGGTTINGFGIAQFTNDFVFIYTYAPDYSNITTVGGVFPSRQFQVALQSHAGVRTANSIVVTRLSTTAPEPATWATMLIGFGLVGAALRSRRGKLAGLAA